MINKPPTVGLGVLENVNEGDTLKLCFTPNGTYGVTVLIGMLRNGQIWCNNPVALYEIYRHQGWGANEDRTATIVASALFDSQIFRERLEPYLEKLEIVADDRPLIDPIGLDEAGTVMSYCFKPNADAIVLTTLLNLHWAGVLGVAHMERLVAACNATDISAAPQGFFITRAARKPQHRNKPSVRLGEVIPQLAFLRSDR